MHTIRREEVVSSTRDDLQAGHTHFSVEVWTEGGEGSVFVNTLCPDEDGEQTLMIEVDGYAVVSPADLILAVEELCKTRVAGDTA